LVFLFLTFVGIIFPDHRSGWCVPARARASREPTTPHQKSPQLQWLFVPEVKGLSLTIVTTIPEPNSGGQGQAEPPQKKWNYRSKHYFLARGSACFPFFQFGVGSC